ncbi:MAG: hypothetical protein SNH01_01020 [Rikenellaceae bacterium]
MKQERSIYDVTRYPISVGILLSLVVGSLAIWRWSGENLSLSESIVTPSFWGGYIYDWQVAHSGWARTISASILFYLAMKMGILTKKFNLMGRSTHLPFDIFLLLSFGILLNVSYLRFALMALVVSWSLSLFFSSYRSANSAKWLFDGGFYLGLLPMFYPPALLLCALMPFVLILFERTLREALVALLGVVTIPFGYIYVRWCMGGEFSTPLQQFSHDLMTHSEFRFESLFDNITIAIVVMVLYSALNAILVSSLLDNTPKAKRRLRVVIVMSLLMGAMLLLPSADSTIFGLLAIPLSILVTVTLLKSPRWLSFILYWGLIISVVGKYILA